MKLYCQSYETLIKLKIKLDNNITNFENSIPISSKDCKVIFKSLTTFKLKLAQNDSLSKNILDNIYNNFKAMPSLKKLLLDFVAEEIDEEYFKKFIKKVLSLKLPIVHVNIRNEFTKEKDYYLEKDYKELFPGISFDYYYNEIYILKFKKEKKKEQKKIKKQLIKKLLS